MQLRLLKSLTRGLAARDCLVEQAEPARLTEVAAHLGVDKSCASHILRMLVASGYAGQVAGRRRKSAARIGTSGSQGRPNRQFAILGSALGAIVLEQAAINNTGGEHAL